MREGERARATDRIRPGEQETVNTYRTMAHEHTIPTPYNYDGQHCPNCGHDNITADAPELNDEEINRTAVCGNCGAKWIEVYSLIGYANLDNENGNEQEIPDDGKFGEVELKQQRDELLEALVLALPYVTDAEGFPEQFKPGVVVRHVKQIRAAIAKATGQK